MKKIKYACIKEVIHFDYASEYARYLNNQRGDYQVTEYVEDDNGITVTICKAYNNVPLLLD